MKVVVASAGPFARALGLAASLVPADKKFAAVWVVNLVSADDGSVLLTRNVLDFQVTLKVPATIARPGSLAVPSDQLARLVAGFPATAEIVVETEGSAARVRSGRSHYRLPVTPLEDLPLALTVLEDGKLELIRTQAHALFAPAACAAAHDARVYLQGLHIHDGNAGLTGVATNGYALNRRVLPGITGWGSAITVPNAAVKIINKLLADKSADPVTLRHTERLFALATPAATLVTRLIDGRFPDYGRIIPAASGNVAAVQRDALAMALARFTAIGGKLVQLAWGEGEPVLRLTTTADNSEDLDADIAGAGKVVVAIDRFTDLLAALTGKTVGLDSTDASTPILITDHEDAGVTTVLAPTPLGVPA